MPARITLEPDEPIVMVDDSDDDLMIAKMCYEDSELTNPFVALKSGPEALTYLEQVAKNQAPMPGVMLLDINMPGMDGFEVLKEIRRQERFRKIPVIMMLTNSDNPKDIAASKKFGADDFHNKPIQINDYIAFFNQFGGKQRA